MVKRQAGPNAALISANIELLEQALSLVEQLDDDSYATSPRGLEPHRAGGHLRHILEFYECFLDGLEFLHIDYGARRRDEAVEGNRRHAAERIRLLMGRLVHCPVVRTDPIVFVKVENPADERPGDRYMCSSVRRELQALSSHTIHHFALIAVTLRAHGLRVDATFGMSPSTLRFEASRALASEVEAA